MAWTDSKVFAAWFSDVLKNTTAIDLDSDTFNVALHDNTITPSQIVTAANSAYNAGVWASGHVSDATGWPQAGRPLASVTVTDYSTASFKWDAADTVSANATTTLASVYGCQVYDDTMTTPVADQGVCYIYFGGANSVTSGTFTVVWHANGLVSAAL